MADPIIVVETPRDAFQGLKLLVPTAEKVRYIRALLDAGFKHLDVGSFVSPRAVPQMSDTRAVVEAVRGDKSVEYIALVPNLKGVERAIETGGLDTLGFPFSFCNQFQVRNTNATVSQTWPIVELLIAKTEEADMSFLAYLSMAFGNSYGDAWDEDALLGFLAHLSQIGIRHVALSDTVGVARPEQVRRVFARARAERPELRLSAHFHGRPDDWHLNVFAALEAGCRRFDGAAGGLGGCPFAQDQLVANVPSEGLVARLEALGHPTGVDAGKLAACAEMAREFQTRYG